MARKPTTLQEYYKFNKVHELTQRIDDTPTDKTYLGWADTGTPEAEGSWAIQLIDETGSTTKIEWADGDMAFDNVWDDRSGLSYS